MGFGHWQQGIIELPLGDYNIHMSKEELRSKLLSFPFIGSVLRLAKAIIGLPARQRVQESFNRSVSEHISALNEQLEHTVSQEKQLDSRISLLQQQINSPTGNGSETATKAIDSAKLDDLYLKFENHFRGTETEIKQRLLEYLPYFKASGVDLKKHPVIDIGSGRGEFLELLRDNGFSGIGVDTNNAMIVHCHKKGLAAEPADATLYLQSAKPGSLGAITGFHIIEHMPFQTLLGLLFAAHRALVKDGFILLETPNPENLSVGSNSFYLDPSHLKPIPPALLEFTLKNTGFHKLKTMRLHPPEHDTTIVELAVPRDYAIIAYK
jgi:2-polyprenyl-3-methyl-5-hydroxy-6-metoxy-1,4-benzoquinol methylase